MVRGVGSESAPLLMPVKRERNRAGKLIKYSRRFFNFATSVLKMGLYRQLVHEDPLTPGFVGLPRGLDDEFYRQLTSESRQAKKNRAGFTVYEWVKDPKQANEMLDTHLQAEAAALKLGVRVMLDAIWARYEVERETAEPDAQLDLEDGLFGFAAGSPLPVPAPLPVATEEMPRPAPTAKAAKPKPRWGAYRN